MIKVKSCECVQKANNHTHTHRQTIQTLAFSRFEECKQTIKRQVCDFDLNEKVIFDSCLRFIKLIQVQTLWTVDDFRNLIKTNWIVWKVMKNVNDPIEIG